MERSLLMSAEEMAQSTTSGFSPRRSCFALAGGHCLPMHGPLLFVDQVCPRSITKQKRAGHVCFQHLSWLLLEDAVSSETQNSFSSQSYLYPLHFPMYTPQCSLGDLPVCGCPLPCSARMQLCMDMRYHRQTHRTGE